MRYKQSQLLIAHENPTRAAARDASFFFTLVWNEI